MLRSVLGEERDIATRNDYEEWGPAYGLSIEDYMVRQETVIAAAGPSLRTWVWTSTPTSTDYLSQCETFSRPALLVRPGANAGLIEDGIVHNVASVFTKVEHRRRGHAARMLEALQRWMSLRHDGDDDVDGQACVGSLLFSDIGRVYYDALGWRALDTTTTTIDVAGFGFSDAKTKTSTLRIDDDDGRLRALLEADVAHLRASASEMARTAHKATVICLPTMEIVRCMFAKSRFYAGLRASEPDVRDNLRECGAVCEDEGGNSYVLWNHDHTSKVLYISRLWIDVDAETQAERHDRIRQALVAAAVAEARRTGLETVIAWGDVGVAVLSGVRVHDRDDSIPCLWVPPGEKDVEWIAGEKLFWV